MKASAALPAAAQIDAEHRAPAARQQPLGQGRVPGPAHTGVVHRPELGPLGEEGRKRRGVLAAAFDAQPCGAQSSQCQPGVERREIHPEQTWRWRRASRLPRVALSTRRTPPLHVAVPGEVLGEAVDHQVGAVSERLKEERRGERRVAMSAAPDVVGRRRHRGDIGEADERVGDHLDHHRTDVRTEGGGDQLTVVRHRRQRGDRRSRRAHRDCRAARRAANPCLRSRVAPPRSAGATDSPPASPRGAAPPGRSRSPEPPVRSRPGTVSSSIIASSRRCGLPPP